MSVTSGGARTVVAKSATSQTRTTTRQPSLRPSQLLKGGGSWLTRTTSRLGWDVDTLAMARLNWRHSHEGLDKSCSLFGRETASLQARQDVEPRTGGVPLQHGCVLWVVSLSRRLCCLTARQPTHERLSRAGARPAELPEPGKARDRLRPSRRRLSLQRVAMLRLAHPVPFTGGCAVCAEIGWADVDVCLTT